MNHTAQDTTRSTGENLLFWVPDGGLMLDVAQGEPVTDAPAEDPEALAFSDGCAGIAEGSVWDAWAGTYLGTPDARFARFAEYVEHPAYDGVA